PEFLISASCKAVMKLSGVAVPSCSCGSSHRGAMAVCQASVIAPFAAAAAAAGVNQGPGTGATVAAPPTSKSLLVSAIEPSVLLSLPAMVSSLRDPRLPGGHCD